MTGREIIKQTANSIEQNITSGTGPDKGAQTGKRQISIENEEEWKKLFDGKKIETEPNRNKDVHTLPSGKKTYIIKDEKKYRGVRITGRIFEEIKDEISKNVEGDINFIELKASRNQETGIPEPAVRIVVSAKEELSIGELLNGPVCQKFGVKAITLCLPNEERTRGIRGRVDKDGTRVYEVVNGSYEMTLKWHAQGKECVMKINLDDNGLVGCISHNGVNMDDLKANTVKVGRQYEAKSLYEIFASEQKQESSEAVKILPATPSPSTSVTGTKEPQQHLSNTCHR